MSAFDLLALPFDQYQRYTAVVQVAEQVRGHLARPELEILDVGGFFRTRFGEALTPLTWFLPRDRVLVADRVTEPLPHYVIADGRSLPFGDQAFDLVVSCDTLEHVPPANRPAFVDELLRVSRHYAVVIAPFDDPAVRLAERIVWEYLTGQGLDQPQLEEHLQLGLPDAGALRAYLAGRGCAWVDFGDGYLHHWLLMMLIKHTPGQSLDFAADLDRYYNQHLSPGDRCEPAYRRVFVIARSGPDAWLPMLMDRLHPGPSRLATPSLDFLFTSMLVLHLRRAASGDQAPTTVDRQLAQARAQLAALHTENESLRQLVAAYERGRFIRLMRQVARWRQRLGL